MLMLLQLPTLFAQLNSVSLPQLNPLHHAGKCFFCGEGIFCKVIVRVLDLTGVMHIGVNGSGHSEDAMPLDELIHRKQI